MMIPIHKVLGRSSWALVAAGALGTTAPALGQSFPYPPAESQGSASPSVVNEQHPEQAERPAPTAPSPRGESPRSERHPNLGSQKTITPITYPTKWRRAEDTRGAASANKPARETTPAQGREGLMWIDTQHGPAQLLELVPRPAPTSLGAPHSNGHATAIRLEVPAAGALTLGPMTSVLPAPAPEPDAYVTSGMIWLDAPPEPPTRPIPVEDLGPQSSRESDGYIGRGVMWLETVPEAPAPPAANKRPPEPILLTAAKSPEDDPARLPELPKIPEQKRYQAPAPATRSVIREVAKADSEKVEGASSVPARVLPPELPKAPAIAKTERPVTPPAPAKIPPLSSEVRPPPQPQPVAVAMPSPTISNPSTSSTMSPTPLYLPVESFKELRGNKAHWVAPTSQAHLSSTNKTATQSAAVVLPSKSALPTFYSVVAPAPVVLESPNLGSPLAPVEKLPASAGPPMTNSMAKLAEAPPATPQIAASVENGSVLLGATTKHGSPYMPTGPQKETTIKAPAEPMKSAASVASRPKSEKAVVTRVSATEPTKAAETPPSRGPFPAHAVSLPAVSSRKQASAPGTDAYVSTGVVILDSTETIVERKPDPAKVVAPKPDLGITEHKPEPAKVTEHKPEPAKVTEHKPEPAKVAEYKPEPPRVADHKPEPAKAVEPKPEPPKVAERKPEPALVALQARLQKRMADACGKPAKVIEVTAETQTKIQIRMKARTTQEAEELSKKILQLPELVPIDVSLDVVITP